MTPAERFVFGLIRSCGWGQSGYISEVSTAIGKEERELRATLLKDVEEAVGLGLFTAETHEKIARVFEQNAGESLYALLDDLDKVV